MTTLHGAGGPTFTVTIDDGEPVVIDSSLTGSQAVRALFPAIEAAVLASYAKGARGSKGASKAPPAGDP